MLIILGCDENKKRHYMFNIENNSKNVKRAGWHLKLSLLSGIFFHRFKSKLRKTVFEDSLLGSVAIFLKNLSLHHSERLILLMK